MGQSRFIVCLARNATKMVQFCWRLLAKYDVSGYIGICFNLPRQLVCLEEELSQSPANADETRTHTCSQIPNQQNTHICTYVLYDHITYVYCMISR